MHQISILNSDSLQFASYVNEHLGKGYQHALKYYKAFYAKGDGMQAYNLKEPQAELLFQEIKGLCFVPSYEIKTSLSSSETEKYVLKFHDGLIAELVVIAMKTGLTLCVSSQVGCKMACAFCETGRMGKLRDLSVDEILTQVFFAKHVLKKNIKNIVFMGMGEPFDNFETLTKALSILTDVGGFNFPPSHSTVSTSGIVPRIYDFIPFGKLGIKLAISVNGSNPENRTRVMPVTRKYSMQDLKQSLITFTQATNQTILAEYVMMKGINDELVHADELCLYLSEIPSVINLIPYNAQSHDKFSPPSDEVIKAFQEKIKRQGFKVFIRQNKGNKIMAACGQLGQLDLKKSVLQKV